MATSLFGNLAGGLGATLGFYYFTYFWQLTSEQSLVVVLGLFLGAAIALPLGSVLSRRYGKKPTAIGMVLAALAIGPIPQLLRLVGWFPENGTPALVPLLFIHNVISNMLGIAATILIIAMVSDVVEDSQIETGRRSEGLFLATLTFITKCATGLGLLASGVLIDAIGFPEHALPGAVDPAVLRNLVLSYTPLTVILYLLMLVFLATYRIDRATHEANLRRLAAGELALIEPDAIEHGLLEQRIATDP